MHTSLLGQVDVAMILAFPAIEELDEFCEELVTACSVLANLAHASVHFRKDRQSKPRRTSSLLRWPILNCRLACGRTFGSRRCHNF